jgi:hypothetical protein
VVPNRIALQKNSLCTLRRSAFGVRRSFPTLPSSLFALPSRARSAFTLVETALALLAISLGLLGIFGLARHGLKNGGDTENETRCTLLADTVFETLKTKNNALLNEGVSLDEWRNFWYDFCDNKTAYDSIYSCYLPQLSDITSKDTALKIIYGTHNLQDQLSESEREPDKWNPQYSLEFINVIESQFTIRLSIHPGALQSGADKRIYYMTLGYVGGLP